MYCDLSFKHNLYYFCSVWFCSFYSFHSIFIANNFFSIFDIWAEYIINLFFSFSFLSEVCFLYYEVLWLQCSVFSLFFVSPSLCLLVTLCYVCFKSISGSHSFLSFKFLAWCVSILLLLFFLFGDKHLSLTRFWTDWINFFKLKKYNNF